MMVWWMITPSAAWQMAVKLSSTMLPLRHFVATVFEPDLSVSTQWIPINECLMTWLSQVLISRNIAKDCRSHSDLFTQQWRQTTQRLYDLTFPKSRNNLDKLDVPSLHPRVSQLSYYWRLWVGPWHIYMLRSCCYQHCQFPCHMGVTLGGTLIYSHMIKPDKMTWGASISMVSHFVSQSWFDFDRKH